MSHTEADRVAFNEWMARKDEAYRVELHAAEVAQWLADNPEIGVLNGGKYYRFENGAMAHVEELQT